MGASLPEETPQPTSWPSMPKQSRGNGHLALSLTTEAQPGGASGSQNLPERKMLYLSKGC